LKIIKECLKKLFNNILVFLEIKEWDLVVLELEEDQEDIQLHSCQELLQTHNKNRFQVEMQLE